ncbi:DUF2255 family protein [Isoptericola aurantiacus]|uniref:DUF2255 family protein n=1 Tax=Isoptericola aurantiacus TaxID=3377839 RepID=UPI00383B6BF8
MTTPSLQDLATLPSAHLVTGEGPGTPAWTVELGHELYVRSAPGSGTPRTSGGRAVVRVAGVEHHVTLAEVAPEVHDLLDDAYRAKYGRCTPEKVSAVVSDVAAATTFRLTPRRRPWWEVAVTALADRAPRRPSAWPAGVPGAVRRRGAEVPCTAC